jgi:hypothetical protein
LDIQFNQSDYYWGSKKKGAPKKMPLFIKKSLESYLRLAPDIVDILILRFIAPFRAASFACILRACDAFLLPACDIVWEGSCNLV